MKPEVLKHHVVIALTTEQHTRVRARCLQEGEPMSVLLPRVLDQWASDGLRGGPTTTIRRAKPATYRK